MSVVEITQNQKDQWDDFVSTNAKDGGLLQSWQWGEFKSAQGHNIHRLAIMDGGKITATALIIRHNLPLKQNYLYVPRGPVSSNKYQGTSNNDCVDLFGKIGQIAREEESIFLKIEPTDLALDVVKQFKKSNTIQPLETLVLDLSLSEEELLKQMKSKTRYNIRLAEKRGVKIRIGEKSDFESFWKVLEKTAERQKITNFEKNYYQKLFEVFFNDQLKLYLAEYKGKVAAANITLYYGDHAYYFFGGQSYEFREVMAPHLLQWQQIKDAKNAGKKYYDFWGVSSTKENWQGITRFKVGFIPNQSFTKYIGGYDFVYKKYLYQLYTIAKGIKR
ncbi:peptidoglycan bridge formation glycyltransferase FemA/FemB family protein [Patescibacteria group bacterium]|nr:peptidoglycan bridge formation glycyltransferase FemA/FemB family protein [Patescibacteria group bacterium]